MICNVTRNSASDLARQRALARTVTLSDRAMHVEGGDIKSNETEPFKNSFICDIFGTFWSWELVESSPIDWRIQANFLGE